MQQIKLYIPKVLLTFLLIFLLIGTELSLLIQHKALAYPTFEIITEQQNLDQKTYDAIASYFQSRSNSTAIPPEIYLDTIHTDQLKTDILYSVYQGFDYLNGKSETYEFTMHFGELEESVTNFFEQYADENSYQKDDAFYQKIQENISEAESKILYYTDTFKFSTLYERGWLAKIRSYLRLFRTIMTVLCIVTAVTLIALILCCKADFSELLYWLGLSTTIPGLLISLPCLYILATNYFSGFVVKDAQIFAAVVGYLQYVTSQICIASAVTGVIGILLLVIFGVRRSRA